MEKRTVVCLPGDGIGPEVTEAMKRVVAATGVEIEWLDMPAGLSSFEASGDPLPRETIDAIREFGDAIKGPTTTPGGGGFKSVNVRLRQELDLYCGFRPARSVGLAGFRNDVDLVVFRQNTEGLYDCSETIEGEPGSRRSVLTANFTEEAMLRLARRAFLYARANGRTRVTHINKENIHKKWGRMYREAFDAIAADFPGITADHMLVDAMGMKLVTEPQRYQVLVVENMFGDILSDVCAGLIGGLGIAAGANLGDHCAIFEAVHGSAPDIAGKGIANPTALILSSAMLLDHIGCSSEAECIRRAVERTVRERHALTGDMLLPAERARAVGTQAFTDVLIRLL